MKQTLLFAILLALITGCSTIQDQPLDSKISGTQDLVLSDQDLQQIGMARSGSDCLTEVYETSEQSPLAQYNLCNYSISSLNNTHVIIELQKFTSYESPFIFSQAGIF